MEGFALVVCSATADVGVGGAAETLGALYD